MAARLPKNYPGARQHRFSGVSGVRQRTVSKLLLHSTETSAKWGCPGYNGGRYAPTLTVDPWNLIVWQHFDIGESAKALVDPSSTSVRENRDNVDQIEIIGYSDVNIAKTYGFNLRELPQRGIDFIGDIVRWYHENADVPLRIPNEWPMYPDSYGETLARMSGPEYDRFTGVLGHLHAPGNSHGDPAINIKAVMRAAAESGGLDMDEKKVREIVREEVSGVLNNLVPKPDYSTSKDKQWSLGNAIKYMSDHIMQIKNQKG